MTGDTELDHTGTSAGVPETGGPGAPDAAAAVDEDLDDRRGPGTGLWIVLVVVALALGAAIGWRVTKSNDTSRPGRDSVDVGFFQDMAAHHNQAVAMGFTYLEHGTDPLLRQIASEIVVYQASEIGVMNDHLAQWGQQGTEGPDAMAWMGMKVPRDQMVGLATKQQMQQLADARGRDLDQLFSRLMIVHHEGGIHMAQYAATHASTETVRSWARAMVDGQKGEIAELNRWRVRNNFPAVKLTLIG
jgi:uncharacterized protein (DUF305 family)